jgi:serpin B
MKTFVLSFKVVITLVILLSCQRDLSPLQDSNEKWVRALTSSESRIVKSDHIFSLKLFRAISEMQSSNIFISPLSVSAALGMAVNGAANQTYDDILATIELSGLSEAQRNSAFKTLHELLTGIDEQVLYESANSIWYKNGFSVLPEFINLNRDYFFAEVASLQFSAPSAPAVINNWVSEKTHGKIEKILNYIPPDAVLYIINAIYFKAMWQYEFDKTHTVEADFYQTNQTTVKAQMMKLTADLKYFNDSDVEIVDLPYGQGNFSMTVFLPKDGLELNEFIAGLDNEQWNRYLQQMEIKNGTLAFPKLKIEYELLMNDVLKQLGMSSAFSGTADFSRIHANGGIMISRVIHKTYVEVDEEGTEAAAVTAIEIRTTSVGPQVDFYMNVNRPFMFVIREKETNAILFMGKIVQPQ